MTRRTDVYREGLGVIRKGYARLPDLNEGREG
jgi:hypothetical protein